jgi:hypothetical protein
VALSIVGTTGVFFGPSAPASAATSGGAASSIVSLQSQIVSTARQLGVLSSEIATTQAHLQAANAALRADEVTLSHVRGDLRRAKVRLRSIALDTYMGSGNVTNSGFPWGSPTTVAASQAYEQMAADSESSSADAYQRSQRLLAVKIGQVRSERATIAGQFAALEQRSSALSANVAREESILTALRRQQARRPPPRATAPQGLPLAVIPIARATTNTTSTPVATTAPPASTTSPVTSVTSPPPPPSSGSLADDLAKLRQCESGDDYQANTGNGYYGAYQFSLATWRGLGYGGLPSAAPPATQDAAATRLEETSGWGQWPVCAAELGLD